MKRMLDPEHALVDEEQPAHELVLGAPALLGIFVAVSLVCAVCFGFGYSSGHNLHVGASESGTSIASSEHSPQPLGGAAAGEDSPSAGDQGAPPKPTPDLPQPDEKSYAAQQVPVPGAVANPPSSAPNSPEAYPSPIGKAEGPNSTVPAREHAPYSGQLAAAPQRAENSNLGGASTATVNSSVPPVAPQLPKAHQPLTVQRTVPQAPYGQRTAVGSPATENAAPLVRSAAAAPGAAAVMVQIAAVSQAADAESLAQALRHDGFAATVRTSLNDSYFHVQIGPFASMDAARAMRARLANDGYNAFIKH